MQLVYTHPNHFAVGNMRNILENAGIECEIHNEFSSGAAGELAPIDVWPELWIREDTDYDRAMHLLDNAQARAGEADWFCGRCGEQNAATFDFCWACGRERRE